MSKTNTIVVVVDKNAIPVVSMGGDIWAYGLTSMNSVDEVMAHAIKKRDYLNQPVTTGLFKWKKTQMREGAPYRLMALTFPENPGTNPILATVHHDDN